MLFNQLRISFFSTWENIFSQRRRVLRVKINIWYVALNSGIVLCSDLMLILFRL
jgi:hypothetical protein